MLVLGVVFKTIAMGSSEKLIATIKEKKIRPVPRWHFLLKNSLFIGGFMLAVLLGGLAFSVVLFSIQQTDFILISHMSHSGLEFFLSLLPVFWIVMLLVFCLIGMYGLRYSRKGYKYSLARQVGFSAVLSILIGTLFFISGGGHWLEHVFAVNVGLYESVQEKKIKLWVMPEEGHLAGSIETIEENSFRLVDFHGHSWNIDFSDASVAPVVLLEAGEEIKVIGAKTGDGQFRAEEIRPWQGPGWQSRHGKK